MDTIRFRNVNGGGEAGPSLINTKLRNYNQSQPETIEFVNMNYMKILLLESNRYEYVVDKKDLVFVPQRL